MQQCLDIFTGYLRVVHWHLRSLSLVLGCWVVGLLGRSQLQLCLHTRCNCFGPGAGAAGPQFRALQIWFAGVPAMGVRVCEENNKLENRHHRISIRV